MPFFRRQNILNNCLLGIWQVNEDIQYFLNRLILHEDEKNLVEKLSERKKLEWYASRWTLHLLSGRKDRGACKYDDHGKPYLEHSEMEISMSHSKNFVAVMAGKNAIGVDIQVLTPKILRLKEKFLSENEQEMIDDINPIELLHIYWGAKECLYKAYSKGKLAFAEHIKIDPFFYYPKGGKTTGTVKKEDYFRTFEIEYCLIENYMLVYAKEMEPV